MITKLQDKKTITREDVNAAILRNDPSELELVPITVALSNLDIHFAQSVCMGLASSPDNKVRGSALVSLGHLARRYRVLDERSVKPCIESALLDSDEYVRESAKSAADEIHQFLHWHIRGHVYG
jgi:hypothetical protein